MFENVMIRSYVLPLLVYRYQDGKIPIVFFIGMFGVG
jgi:hypothetical protein